nr:MAG TPA: hypothetical protein [Caudoviricetes sp.]
MSCATIALLRAYITLHLCTSGKTSPTFTYT